MRSAIGSISIRITFAVFPITDMVEAGNQMLRIEQMAEQMMTGQGDGFLDRFTVYLERMNLCLDQSLSYPLSVFVFGCPILYLSKSSTVSSDANVISRPIIVQPLLASIGQYWV